MTSVLLEINNKLNQFTRDSCSSKADNDLFMDSMDRMPLSSSTESLAMTVSFANAPGSTLCVHRFQGPELRKTLLRMAL